MEAKLTLTRHMPELRRELLAQRHDFLARLTRMEDDLRALGESIEPERGDEAQEESTGRCLARLDDLERQRLSAIDDALARMARGEYGVCTTCGEAIGIARLRTLPDANQCLRCAGVIGELRHRA